MFKKLKVLPLCSQYILSLSLFVVKNKDLFLSNSEIHTINTRNSNNLHYLGIKVFNSLPSSIRNLAHDVKHFRIVLKRFLLLNSFYSLEEYLDCKFDSNYN
jgi:hypothetical protein